MFLFPSSSLFKEQSVRQRLIHEIPVSHMATGTFFLIPCDRASRGDDGRSVSRVSSGLADGGCALSLPASRIPAVSSALQLHDLCARADFSGAGGRPCRAVALCRVLCTLMPALGGSSVVMEASHGNAVFS